MEQTNTTEAPEAPTTGVPETPMMARELLRPREGRMLAGVAQGLANRYDLPVLLIRVIFVLLIFGGGLGVALYAAGWFLIRSDDEAETPAERIFSNASTSKSWIGIGLVFVAILILLDNFTFLSGGIVWAVGLLVVGVLLYTGDLPRLVRNSRNDEQEGVQQMTTTDTRVTATVEPVALSGSDDAGDSAPPPTPTPTPPLPPPPPAKPRETSYLGRITIGVMLVSLGVLAVLDNISGIPIEPQPRHYIALAVTILGIGLMVGGFLGRARWLILIGVLLVPTMLFSPAFEYDWNTEEFDRTYSPDSFAELEDTYAQDVGNLVVDLTDLPWDGEVVDLTVTVDAGNIEIWIPPGVGLEGEASVDIGHVGAFGRETSGLGSPSLEFNNPGPEGTVVLDAMVDLGNIDIQVGR